MDDETFREKIRERQGATAIRAELEEQITGLNDEIKTELALRGADRFPVDQWEAKLIVSERESLDKKKLLSAGVSVAQIKAATTVTPVITLRVDKASRAAGS